MAAKERYGKGLKLKEKGAEHGDKPKGVGQQPAKAEAAKPKVETKSETKAPKGDKVSPEPDVAAGTDHIPVHARHATERMEQHHRHMREHTEMHGRHEREHIEARMGNTPGQEG